jgi:hypothetical protein
VNYENYVVQREMVQVGLKSHMNAFGPTKDASIIPVLRLGEVLTTSEEVQSYIDEVEALIPPPPLELYTLTFISVGTVTWTAPDRTISITYLIVGGGGGGGAAYDSSGGGGGGGGLALLGTLSVNPKTVYTIVVGNGGAGGVGKTSGTPRELDGDNGQNSSFDTIVAAGGEGGHRSRSFPDGRGVGGVMANGLIPPQGGNGGGANRGAGGGGGNASRGLNSTLLAGASGGAGLSSNLSGTFKQYGAGGLGGSARTSRNGSAGAANTGNGGGGASAGSGSSGGRGGSGIIIIQFWA